MAEAIPAYNMDTYVVTIEPRFDCALIVEFVIAIDLRYRPGY
jgi:hypothetical protein